MQITATDRAAALFFEENAATIASYGLSHFDRAERQLIRQGKKAIAALESAAKAAINPRSAEATRWTPEEYDCLAAAYMVHGADERACLTEFRSFSERHSDYAVRLAVNSCKFLDTRIQDAKGLSDYANGLLDALKEHDAARFQGRR